MRKLWHRLFGHGYTQLNASLGYQRLIVCKCGYWRPLTGYTVSNTKSYTLRGNPPTWTEVTNSPTHPYKWSPEDNG